MKPHQQRVIEEKTALDEKLEKLFAFLHGGLQVELPEAEQERLGRQLAVMKQYSNILGERIAAF